MKKLTRLFITVLLLFTFVNVSAVTWSNPNTMTYYKNGYSWGWDYYISNIKKESISTGSSVYAIVSYTEKTSWTAPLVRLVNTYQTYRSNATSMSSTTNSNLRLYNNTAPQNEWTNILIVGNSSQVGADTVWISFTPN